MEPNDTWQTATVMEKLGPGGFGSSTRFDDIGLNGDIVDIFRIPIGTGVRLITAEFRAQFQENELANQGWWGLQTSVSVGPDVNASGAMVTYGMRTGWFAHGDALTAANTQFSDVRAAMDAKSLQNFLAGVSDPALGLDLARWDRINAILSNDFDGLTGAPIDLAAVAAALQAEMGGVSSFAGALHAAVQSLLDVVESWDVPVYFTSRDFGGETVITILDTFAPVSFTLPASGVAAAGLFVLGETSVMTSDGSQVDIALPYSLTTRVGVIDPAIFAAAMAGATAGSDAIVAPAAGRSGNLLAGNDRFQGSSLMDAVAGGIGNDTLMGGAGDDQLRGEAGSDRLHGQAGADRLIGGGGADILWGGSGRDTLVGGAGADIFVFDSALVAANRDVISDYDPALDTIRLAATVFGALPTGQIAASALQQNLSGQATTVQARIIYETDTGALFYDANGSAAGGRVQFAALSPGLALTAADFFVF